jgi:hypothetical protein
MLIKEKTKSVQINEEIHNKLKIFCGKKALKISRFIEDIIIRELNNYDSGKR